MAWPNRETAGRIQAQMTSWYRTRYSELPATVPPADRAAHMNPYTAATHFYAMAPATSVATYQDYVQAAFRSLRSVEAGRAMHDNPLVPLRLGQIPRNYGIRTPANRIEYRVVVRGLTTDQGHPRTEGLIVVRSRDPLTLAQLEAEARRVLVSTDASHQYQTRVPLVGADVQIQFHVAAVSRHEPS